MADWEDIRALHQLIGNYEATTKQIFNELKEINKNQAHNDRDHREIKQRIAEKEQTLENHETRLKAIEKTGVPKKTNNKIDGALILGILNGLVTIIKTAFGIP